MKVWFSGPKAGCHVLTLSLRESEVRKVGRYCVLHSWEPCPQNHLENMIEKDLRSQQGN
jgi:hypothetical protein